MPDPVREARIADAAKMMLSEAKGQPYEVRRRFGMLVPILRGHKLSMASMTETATGTVGQCEVCDQVVKVPHDGDGVEGRAVENDCPAAEWKR